MKTHMKNIHEGRMKNFVCLLCEKTFRTEASLKVHSNLNLCEVDPSTCEFCGKIFKYKKDLKSHIFNHNNEDKKINCDDCGKSFNKVKLVPTQREGARFVERKFCQGQGGFERRRWVISMQDL